MPGGQTRLAKCSPTLNCWCKVMLKDENSYLPSNAFPLKKKIATRKFNMLCVPCLVCTLLVPSPLFYTEETPCCRCVPLFQCDCAVPTGHKTTLKGRDSCTVLSCCALCLQQILLDTVVHYGTVCSHAISCPLKDKIPLYRSVNTYPN